MTKDIHPESLEYALALETLSNFKAEFSSTTLANARAHFQTQVFGEAIFAEPEISPPREQFVTLSVDSNGITLPAFVTPDPNDGKRHPAIVWITGGESNNLFEFWHPAPFDNDETASQFRNAGIVTLFPSFRGGNTNTGEIEYNYGEVNDVIAATKLLATLPYVDPTRIYLGGHSCGGTMALLISEIVSQTEPTLFKAIVCFGATELVYTPGFEDKTSIFETFANASQRDKTDVLLRSPYFWLDDICIPTLLIEGLGGGNVQPLQKFAQASQHNDFVTCLAVNNLNHFSVLAPTNALIAEQISQDEAIYLTDAMINSSKQNHDKD